MMKILFSLLLSAQLLAVPAWATQAGTFGGVGIDGVPRADGSIVVRQLVLGGPAQLAGIRAGDVITQIDGTPTVGNDFKFLVERRLRGRAGTKVLIKVRRPGNPKTLNFKLVRRQLAVPGTGKNEQPKGE